MHEGRRAQVCRVDAVAHLANLYVQVDFAFARRVAHEPEESAFDNAIIHGKSWRDTVEMAEQYDVVAGASCFRDRVSCYDCVAEEFSDEHDAGFALLGFEGDEADFGAAGLYEVHAAVADSGQAWGATLGVVGAIQIVATDGQGCALGGGNGEAVAFVVRGAIGAAGDLLVDSPLAVAIPVRVRRRVERIELSRAGAIGNGHAACEVGKEAGGADGGQVVAGVGGHAADDGESARTGPQFAERRGRGDAGQGEGGADDGMHGSTITPSAAEYSLRWGAAVASAWSPC